MSQCMSSNVAMLHCRPFDVVSFDRPICARSLHADIKYEMVRGYFASRMSIEMSIGNVCKISYSRTSSLASSSFDSEPASTLERLRFILSVVKQAEFQNPGMVLAALTFRLIPYGVSNLIMPRSRIYAHRGLFLPLFGIVPLLRSVLRLIRNTAGRFSGWKI